MISTRSRHYWSRGDKALLWGIVLALVGGIGWGIWLNFVGRDPVVRIPAENLPRPNAFDYYVAAGRHAHVPNRLTVTRYPMRWSTRVDKIVDANRTALAIARQGMNYPYAMPRSAVDTSVYDTDYVELMKAFDLQAQADYRHGRWCAGIGDCIDVLHITQDIAQSGGPMGSDIGLTERYQAIPMAMHAVDHLSSAQCRQIIGRLEAIDGREVPFVEIARQFKVQLNIAMAQKLRQGELPASLFSVQGRPIVDLTTLRNRLHDDMASRRLAYDDFEAAVDGEVQAARLPYVAFMAHGADRDPYGIRDSLKQARVERSSAHAEMEMFITGLALRGYRVDHGAYPKSLSALVPRYLQEVPIDPFDDQTMRYERVDAAYRLWCIGPDLRDDFGVPVPPPAPWALGDQNARGDLVLGVNGY